MGNTFYLTWEPSLMIFLQQYMGPFLTQVASIVTMFGEELILIAVLGFLYWCYDKEYAKFVGTNIVAGTVINPMLKGLALRRRPYFDHEGIKCLRPVESGADIYDISAQGFSFPSGHSMNSVIVYGSLSRYKSFMQGRRSRILTVIAIVMPLLIGLSRVVLGVHYPTDVLAGWAVGLIIIFLLSWLQKKVKKQAVLHLILVILGLPGIFFCRTSDYFTGLGLMIGFFLAVAFEERFVRFEMIRYGEDKLAALWTVLRLVGGIAVYFALNTLLKLPFSAEFLESATTGAFLVRTVRYTIVTFAAIGVYPLVFKLVEKRK